MLNEKQLAAIEFLALPKRGGLTYEGIAERVGVSSKTLLRWRQNDCFNAELKRRVVAATIDRLPEVLSAMPDMILEEKSASMAKVFLQMHSLLSDNVNVAHRSAGENGGTVDINKIRERLLKQRENE